MTRAIDYMFYEEAETLVNLHYESRCIHAHALLVVILRGMPGSGKTTFARFIQILAEARGMPCEIAAADNFFTSIDGYCFDASRLTQAHHQCQDHCASAIQRRVAITVIDNTNIKYFEWKPYMDLARNKAAVCRVNFVCDTVDNAYDLSYRSHADIEDTATSNRYNAYLRDTADFQADYTLTPTFNSWYN